MMIKRIKKTDNKIRIKKNQRYSWCTCRNSKNYPICDGSHKETGDYKPVRIWFHEDLDVFFSIENDKLQLKLEKGEKE